MKPETVDRLMAAARALQAISPKTLAQHEAEEDLARYVDLLTETAK